MKELVDEGLAMLLFLGSKRSQRTDRTSERLGSEFSYVSGVNVNKPPTNKPSCNTPKHR